MGPLDLDANVIWRHLNQSTVSENPPHRTDMIQKTQISNASHSIAIPTCPFINIRIESQWCQSRLPRMPVDKKQKRRYHSL